MDDYQSQLTAPRINRQMSRHVRTTSSESGTPGDAVGGQLTRRERTIAALIGEGLTSAQIGLRLNIAERTVDSHAEHIRNKLRLHSRAQIAAWAVRALSPARDEVDAVDRLMRIRR
jgi:DNA-binding CsgD family transcriptional regulator